MSYQKLEFGDNDIYLLVTTEDYIVINNNYGGLFVLNQNLEKIRDIELTDESIIDCAFSNENKLLMFCSERNVLIFADLVTGHCEEIPIDIDNWPCSPIYDWQEDKVTLFNYAGEQLVIDTKNSKACLTKNSSDKIKELIARGIVSFNFREKLAVTAHEAVEILDCKMGNVVNRIPLDGSYHDYEVSKAYFMAISENDVALLGKQTETKVQARENYFFMRGKFFLEDKEDCVILLSGNKADAGECMLEKYSVDSIMSE
jgi:hypothetical protein